MPTVTKTSKRRPWQAPKRDRNTWGHTQPNRHIYNGKQWKQLRAAYIGENPLCVMCLADGLAVDANVVDHVTPINSGGGVYDIENLQSLCFDHHNAKSRQESAQARKPPGVA